jgi:hypothetical protein
LIGRGKEVAFRRMHDLRDSIFNIKRYLYRRIVEGAFDVVSDNIPKRDLRRLAVWMQPIREYIQPSRTEVYCFNSRFVSKNKNQGIGTPAVLFPPVSRPVEREFFNSSFEKLKNWVYTKRCYPVGLQALLLSKSSSELSESCGCPTIT